MASRKHALGVLLYRTLTASCAVRLPLSKLRTQLNTVLRAGAFSTNTADIRRWISDSLAPSLHRKPAINLCQLYIPSFCDSCSWASSTGTGTDTTVFHTDMRDYGHLGRNAVLRLYYPIVVSALLQPTSQSSNSFSIHFRARLLHD